MPFIVHCEQDGDLGEYSTRREARTVKNNHQSNNRTHNVNYYELSGLNLFSYRIKGIFMKKPPIPSRFEIIDEDID